ncbi:MAG TPA: hypothetical protein VJ302_33605 [Blastocatellia bacterium]|nr:hypothetical protein [Blastocatellia bacterium]
MAGQNYDLLVLSPNRDHCTPPNPQSDYIFHGGPRKIYYKIEDGVLVLFVSIAATPPEGPGFPVSVRQNEIHPLDFADFQKNYQNQGLKLLEVEINRGLKCN